MLSRLRCVHHSQEGNAGNNEHIILLKVCGFRSINNLLLSLLLLLKLLLLFLFLLLLTSYYFHYYYHYYYYHYHANFQSYSDCVTVHLISLYERWGKGILYGLLAPEVPL